MTLFGNRSITEYSPPNVLTCMRKVLGSMVMAVRTCMLCVHLRLNIINWQIDQEQIGSRSNNN